MLAELAAAMALAARYNATIECPDAAGFVAAERDFLGETGHSAIFTWQERRVILSPWVCLWLGRASVGSLQVSGFAVFTLAHELSHARGFYSEASADCNAARTFPAIAKALGLTQERTQQLWWASWMIDGYFPETSVGCSTMQPAGMK